MIFQRPHSSVYRASISVRCEFDFKCLTHTVTHNAKKADGINGVKDTGD